MTPGTKSCDTIHNIAFDLIISMKSEFSTHQEIILASVDISRVFNYNMSSNILTIDGGLSYNMNRVLCKGNRKRDVMHC